MNAPLFVAGATALDQASPSWLLWGAFALAVPILVAVDLGLFQRKPREPTLREALAWSGVWLGLALSFGAALSAVRGTKAGVEFFTGYLVEQALSADNVLVMMLVFTQLAVPPAARRRVLGWGIVGAVVLRGAFVLAGTALVERFHFVTVLLGGALLFAAAKLLRDVLREARLGATPAADGPAEAPVAPWLRRWLGRIVPLTSGYDGSRFFVVREGVRHATPLVIALVTIEVSDAIFALDSLPAVFGVSRDPLVVLTSNVFAVLGLRSLFFVLEGLVARLVYLKHALAVVLLLVGTKMVLGALWEPPTWLTLAAVALVLTVAVVASLKRRGGFAYAERT